MTESRFARAQRAARFLASLIPAALLFLLFYATLAVVSTQIDNGIGVFLGFVAAISTTVGVLLGYITLVDWLNVGIIRKTARDPSAWRDGQVVAVDGVVRVFGAPMRSALSETLCAAYTYRVAVQRRRSSRGTDGAGVIAQGFHLTRTRIEGQFHSISLRSMPAFETDLRHLESRSWGDGMRALIDERLKDAPSAEQIERDGRLLAARTGDIDEVHQDYRMVAPGSHAQALTTVEEVLAVDQRVCAIGTYHRSQQSLTARRSRVGPNLMIYRGSAGEVLARVGRETRLFARAAAWMVAFGLIVTGFALVW